jgi:glycerol uptake operon antiterminator
VAGVLLTEKSIIPSVRELKYLDQAFAVNSKFILLSNANIGNLKDLVSLCHKHQKRVLVHLELLGGFKPDNVGVRLLKTLFNVDGVISTNVNALRMANDMELFTVYRLFLIDSRSLTRFKSIFESVKFSALEVLPAEYALEMESGLRKYVGNAEMIAGGFIRSQSLASQILNASFMGLTTSETKLWRIS